ncbi:uncharacterized protein Dwil_GK20817 [Drosophila willistoni]|uniref:Ig-like domain-containing protein n=2 Tax=Drosophila willistoni TaxID=7260 RepID=B4MJG4_DROWI|nr:uncharacterized protein Dwil_GK20817 [Drosophila willistoni]
MGFFQYSVLADEYAEYNDEEEPQYPPGNLAKATSKPVIPIPYFDEKEAVIYVPTNATTVSLECPVKNYDALHHGINWYKDEELMTNAKSAFNIEHRLDDNYTLTMPLVNVTGHVYSCRVMPSNVRHQITIRIGAAPITTTPKATVDPSPTIISPPTAKSGSSPVVYCLWLLLASFQGIRRM